MKCIGLLLVPIFVMTLQLILKHLYDVLVRGFERKNRRAKTR